jgi:8-oxo-dGTP diphosphatase
MANFWELPGGKVEFGEDPKEALKREFQEEVGLQISVDKPIHLFSYLSDNNNRQTVDITFIITLEGENTDIKLSPEHTEYAWVDKNEVGNYSMSDEMKRCIEAGFNQ